MTNSQKNPKCDCPNKALTNKALTTAEQTWIESKNQRKGAKEFSEQSKKSIDKNNAGNGKTL